MQNNECSSYIKYEDINKKKNRKKTTYYNI